MKKVLIYSTPTCGYCQHAKQFFKDNNVDYEEIDVMADQTKAEEMVKKSGQMGVPVIMITNDDGKEEILIGWQQEKLKEILEINN